MDEQTYDLDGEAYAEARGDGQVIIGARKRGAVLLSAEQVAALRSALDREDERADGFGR